MRLTAFAGIVLVCSPAFAETKDAPSKTAGTEATATSTRPLVTVNDKPITQGDLDFYLMTRSVPDDQRSKVHQKFLEQLVERRLIQAYLAGRKVQPDSRDLDAQIARIKRMIAKKGDDPQQVLARLGYDDKTLRDELALPLAWQAYLARVVTPESVRDFFEQHRREFNGSEIRASQVFLKLTDPANETQRTEALQKLRQIRDEIKSGKMTFKEAVQKHSEAPSREMDGDVGFFAYRGKMPLEFTKVVFPLKLGEMSEPFVTRFGAHLAIVTETKAGELSLEDVRPQVLTQISGNLWNETVTQERSKAKIEWAAKK